MPNHRSDIAEVRAAMRAVGYTILQVEPRLENLSGFRPDVLAWASNADGELVPWAVVECKGMKLRQPELVLPALAGSRDLLGTLEHFAVVNGQWFKADRGVRFLQPVDGPTPPEHGSQGVVTDRSLATSLLVQRLWFEADRLRNSGVSADRYFPSGDVLMSSRNGRPGIELPDGGFVPVRADVLWRAKRDALTEFASRGRHREFSSPRWLPPPFPRSLRSIWPAPFWIRSAEPDRSSGRPWTVRRSKASRLSSSATNSTHSSPN